MKDLIFYFALLFLFLFCFVEMLGLKQQQQKIKELEKGVIYFSNEAEKIRQEQDKQARLIQNDLFIFAAGFEVGK